MSNKSDSNQDRDQTNQKRINSKNDIWSKSLQLLEQNKPLEELLINGYSTLVFLGSKSSGKTTIIQRFIQSSSTNSQQDSQLIKETIALEYRFVRKELSNNLTTADSSHEFNQIGKVCNLWELGNGLLFMNLIQFCLTPATIRNTSLVIVMDLTRPNSLSILLENILDKISSYLYNNFAKNPLWSKLIQLAQKRSNLNNKTSKSYSDNSESSNNSSNSDSCKPFPLPVIIVGSKYDEFQNFDPEKKKQIVRYLRTISYHHSAQLLFVSSKSETLTKRIQQSLEQLAFDRARFDQQLLSPPGGSEAAKPSISSSHTKPVLMPFGYDSLQKIGVQSLEEARDSFLQLFPQDSLELIKRNSFDNDLDENVATSGDDQASDKNPIDDPHFAEPEIDQILQYKYMMIDQYNNNNNKNQQKNKT